MSVLSGSNLRLLDKVAIVTGGAQGLGKAIVQRFAREGAAVAIVDLNAERAQAVADECIANGVRAIAIGVDISDSDQRRTVVPTVVEGLGEPDILVNCHGICITRPMMDIPEESFRQVMDINTNSVFFLIQDVAKEMIPRGRGAIVNLASNSAFLPKPEQVDYAASKAAIVSLTRSAAGALGPHGIRVNAIAPGVIPTPMTERIAQERAEIRGATKEEMFKMFEPLTALKRLGTPEEVANVALFLASDEASYVTGQTLEVCGGLLMR